MESRTMVPSAINSHFASRNLVIGAVKSWSVGLCEVVSTSLMPSFSAYSLAPSRISLPKSVSWYITQIAFLPFVLTKYSMPDRIWST